MKSNFRPTALFSVQSISTKKLARYDANTREEAKIERDRLNADPTEPSDYVIRRHPHHYRGTTVTGMVDGLNNPYAKRAQASIDAACTWRKN